MTEVTSLLFNTTSRRALAIVGMIVAIGALFFGVLADDLAAIFLPFAGVVAIVVAWTILSSEHASFSWMKRPLVIALFSAGILGVFFALVFVRPPATIVMFAGVFGAIGACWIWGSLPEGYAEWIRQSTSKKELIAVEDCDVCDGPQKVVYMRQQVADAEDRLRETEEKLAEARKKQRAATMAANKAAAAVNIISEPAPTSVEKPVVKPTSRSKKEVFTTDAPAPKNLIKRRPAKAEIDDLKEVSGIGPVFEKLLNKNGVYQFKQLADFKKRDVEWLSAQIGSFPDRIERDDWVKQAKALARKRRS